MQAFLLAKAEASRRIGKRGEEGTGLNPGSLGRGLAPSAHKKKKKPRL